MSDRRKIVWITAAIVIMAVIIVVCVNLFTGSQDPDYDGTLVKYYLCHSIESV